jgi:hypothetical protein
MERTPTVEGTTMKYMLLIHESEAAWQAQSEERQMEIIGQYGALAAELAAAGKLVSGEPLAPEAMASLVRVREGKAMITDGPFAETREQLGGFYLIDVENLDEALAIAARLPGAASGCVEVRPVPDFG